MKRTSHILSLLLAVVIALTAQSAALARTMPDATGQMVICTGTGPVMMYFDAEGEPTAPPHICPDYALSIVVALDASELVFAAKGAWHSEQREFARVAGRVLHLGTPRARGPPDLT